MMKVQRPLIKITCHTPYFDMDTKPPNLSDNIDKDKNYLQCPFGVIDKVTNYFTDFFRVGMGG